ncbi:MAG: hypothetical protein NVS3B26_24510 [Mycobacteriales bacterium]
MSAHFAARLARRYLPLLAPTGGGTAPIAEIPCLLSRRTPASPDPALRRWAATGAHGTAQLLTVIRRAGSGPGPAGPRTGRETLDVLPSDVFVSVNAVPAS